MKFNNILRIYIRYEELNQENKQIDFKGTNTYIFCSWCLRTLLYENEFRRVYFKKQMVKSSCTSPHLVLIQPIDKQLIL